MSVLGHVKRIMHQIAQLQQRETASKQTIAALEARVAELTAKLSAADGELGALREEAAGLRKTNSKLSKGKLEAENQLQELLIKGSASGAQIQEKDAACAQLLKQQLLLAKFRAPPERTGIREQKAAVALHEDVHEHREPDLPASALRCKL